MRRRIAAVLGAALLFTAAACGSGGGTAGKGGGTGSASAGMTPVQVGVIPIVDVAPIHAGIDQGFFKDEGLDVQLKALRGGEATVPAVMSGDVDFGFSNLVSLLIARDKGLDVQVVAAGNASTGVQGKDFGGIVVPADSPLQTPADLSGKTVSVNSLKNIAELTLRASVDKAGGNPDTLKYVEIAFPDVPAAISDKQVDAAWVVEPFLTIALNQGARLLTSNMVDTAPNLMIAAYFTSGQTAKAKPELVQKFSAAMEKSLAYADTHPDDARKAVLGYTEIKPEIADQMTLPRWPSTVDKNSVQVLADLALQDKLISKEADVGALVP
jgi:NitT/TauT family transport system substrate-binding protein